MMLRDASHSDSCVFIPSLPREHISDVYVRNIFTDKNSFKIVTGHPRALIIFEQYFEQNHFDIPLENVSIYDDIDD